MTREQAEAHQRKHGFGAPMKDGEIRAIAVPVPKPKDRMNKTEREYSLILEAMKRRGKIERYEFEGITLSWGNDPDTGKPMRYTPDFVVFEEDPEVPWILKLIEVKGAHIRSRDLVRFKGCRAWWPQFKFEMHQKKEGRWQRIH